MPSLGTPGDDPLISNRAKWVPRGRPAPRTPEGKPDLSGVYYANKDTPEKAELLPWADTLTKQRRAGGAIGQPSNFCLPGDPLLTLPLFYKIVQSPSAIVMLWEGQPPGVRQIFLDQKDHSKSWGSSWLGHSIGRWEGDTLVVDTAAFNEQSWLGIFPHTEQLHLTGNHRRPELARAQARSYCRRSGDIHQTRDNARGMGPCAGRRDSRVHLQRERGGCSAHEGQVMFSLSPRTSVHFLK